MPIEVLMPALSPTMTEGTLAKWMKKEGEEVAAGDVLAEIETDKATMEVEAVDEGVLAKILVPDGSEGVPVNKPIALLLEEGEDSGALDSYKAGETKAPDRAQSEADAPTEAPRSQPPVADEAPEPVAGQPVAASGNGHAGDRVFASPLARRMAKQAGIDLSAIRGSGPHGRIVKADVEGAAGTATAPGRTPAAAPAKAKPAAPIATPSGPGAKALADAYGMAYELQPNSNIRKTIARRLTEAKQTVPHFYLTVDCEIDLLLQARKAINEQSDGLKISVNDFVIRAAALALKAVPAANASWDEEGILLYENADISVAVATPNGLITPIVKAAESKGLAAISTEMKDLAGRARDGKLKPEEFQGGTFSVSNLGMYGIKDFAAIINPPQGCILAVGAGQQRPVVRNGELTVATVMSCTLSVDHRVVDGAVGAEYLGAFKRLIENPFAMLL